MNGEWITIAEAAQVLGISYNSFAGYSTNNYCGLDRQQMAIGKKQYFNRTQVAKVAEIRSSADISLLSALKVIVAQGGGAVPYIPSKAVPTFNNGSDSNVSPAQVRLKQIRLQLPEHPVDPETGRKCPYHSERFQHIEELLGICDTLMTKLQRRKRH